MFLSGLLAETNSFCPIPTGLGAFEDQGIRRSSSSAANPMGMLPAIEAIRAFALSENIELVEGLIAAAQPLGPVVDNVYQKLRREILNDITAALPVDVVVLLLHGSMTTPECDDCEGDLLAAVRAQVGPDIPIGVVLDPHCHFTANMRQITPIFVAYKEYPHTDIPEAAVAAAQIAVSAARREISPRLGWSECRMMGLWPTIGGAMKDYVDGMRALENGAPILSASLAHGMAYGDVPEAGSGAWVVSDHDQDAADKCAYALAQRLFSIRDDIATDMSALPTALATLQSWSGPKPLVLADTADNPGGGAQGDSSFFLRALVDAQIGRVAIGGIWDPGAVQLCYEAGIGASFIMRISGKTGITSGHPVDVAASVIALCDDHSQDDFGTRAPLGPSAWVQTEHGLDIVLISRRQQVLGTDLFTGLGVDLSHLRGIVVKSMQHFLASFAPHIGGVVHVDSPGLMRADFADIPFRRRSLNYWPRVDNPFND